MMKAFGSCIAIRRKTLKSKHGTRTKCCTTTKLMHTLGPAKKITIHLNEDTSTSTDFLYRNIFQFLLEQGVAGATLIRPDAGFGKDHRIHSRHGEGVAGQHLPVRLE